MVLLSDFLTFLATGEFSNLALNRNRDGRIAESDYEKVMSHINLGMMDLHKRFKLREHEITLQADPAKTLYYLRPEHMAPDYQLGGEKYLLRPEDSDGNINLIKLLSVVDSDGTAYKLNNRHAVPAIMEAAFDTLRITGLTEAKIFTLNYKAYPTEIIVDDDLIVDEEYLEIPPALRTPLLYYVASRVYKPTGSNDSTANADKSNDYMNLYLVACQEYLLHGNDITDNDQKDPYDGTEGWV